MGRMARETIGEAARLKQRFRGSRSQKERCFCNGGLLRERRGGDRGGEVSL